MKLTFEEMLINAKAAKVAKQEISNKMSEIVAEVQREIAESEGMLIPSHSHHTKEMEPWVYQNMSFKVGFNRVVELTALWNLSPTMEFHNKWIEALNSFSEKEFKHLIKTRTVNEYCY